MPYLQRTSLASLPFPRATILAGLLSGLLPGSASGQVQDIGAPGTVQLLLSGDGLSACGTQFLGSSIVRGFRWTNAGGLEPLFNPIAASDATFPGAISDDGSIVVGHAIASPTGQTQPFALRWDAAGNVVELTPPGAVGADAQQVSGDGSVIAGIYRPAGSNWHACVWDATGAITDLHPMLGGTLSSIVELSHDGSTVLGRSTNAAVEPSNFVWTAPTGSIELPLSPLGQVEAMGLSADGSVVVGRLSLPGPGNFGIFYWTAATGYVISDPALGEPSLVKISRDGNLVYGLVEIGAFMNESVIFTWTPTAGFRFYDPDMKLSLSGASFDGSVLVGSMSLFTTPQTAYRWTSATGFVDLQSPSPASSGFSVSLDGTVIGGTVEHSSFGLRGAVWDLAGTFGANYCGPAIPNSTGTGGKIELSGSNITSLASFTMTATDLPPNSFGLFIAAANPGLVMGPGGSLGNLCLGGNVVRFQSNIFQSGSAGVASLTIDPTSFDGPSGPILPAFGDRWYFQAWYRDATPGAGSNFTDGATVALY